MARVPVTRLSIYLSIIAVLGGLLAYGDGGILSKGRLGGFQLFKVPESDTVPFVNQLDESARTDEQDDAPDGGGEEFDFSGELNRLSSSDAASGDDGEAAAKPTPVVPTLVPTSSDFDNAGVRTDSDTSASDARNIFSGLQDDTEEGWNGLGVLGGITSRSNSLMGAGVIPTIATTPVSGRGWVQGQARGYAMLYAMQLEARPVVEVQVQTLLASRVRDLYIGVLVDGTFGRDFNYLKDVISRLSVDNRSLTVALYLSNGATMRKWRETPIDELFSRINPTEFRQLIRRDTLRRSQFAAVVTQARDVFEFNATLNSDNSNVAIVMLEDNLDAAAYRSMRDIASEQLGGLAGFIRNPCLGCFKDGGGDDLTLGNPREEHKPERFAILQSGDAFTLDGAGFKYPNSAETVGVSSDELATLLNSSFQRGLRYFGLWRHQWQGVIEGTAVNPHPTVRNYIPSTPDQQEFEIEALRTGLIPEDPSGSEQEGGI